MSDSAARTRQPPAWWSSADRLYPNPLTRRGCLPVSVCLSVKPRARVAATGLEASALPIDSHEALAEGWVRTLRDVGRTLLWLLTGLHGGSLNLIFHPERVADARARGEWWASAAEARRREALMVERFRAALAE